MKLHVRKAAIILAWPILFSTYLHAQKYTVLHGYGYVPLDGDVPIGRLTLCGTNLYGTTFSGGTNGYGSIFTINTDGKNYNMLYAFSTNFFDNNLDGSNPNGGLVLVSNTLYGVTESGGTNGWGTLYSINTDGSGFNVIHTFGAADGTINGKGDNNPWSDVSMSDGTLFGASLNMVYSVNTNGGNFQLLAQTGGLDGAGEGDFGLILADNTLYGVTEIGGTNGLGSVYVINLGGGGFYNLYNFGPNNQNGYSPDGARPQTTLTLIGNTLYGTTDIGGTNDSGTLFSINTNGSNFTKLHDFVSSSDGSGPGQGLVLAGDTLYGVTQGGGGPGGGTIFSINTNGSNFTVLYSFMGGADGGSPWGGLTLSGCTFYGTTSGGYGGSTGVIYSFALVPGIASWNLVGTNLVLNATNGVANCSYTVLTSTNLALPLNQWTPLATNTLTQAGNFTFNLPNAIAPSASQQFFTLQAQ